MKNLLRILCIVCLTILGINQVTFAQSKALIKDSKKEAKQLQKDGWKMLTGSGTLEYANLKFRTLCEENDEIIALFGLAEGSNVKIGTQNATFAALTDYASKASSQVIGKMKGLSMANNSESQIDETDKFGAAYEIAVKKRIQGLVKTHFVLVQSANGRKMFRAYLSIDESKARKAREKAAEDARVSAGMKQLTDDVKEFIGESVNMD